jgi:DNA-binding response OmpR family regulator
LPPGENHDALKGCVHRLRGAIEPDPARPRYVLAVRGYGYMMPARVDDYAVASSGLEN